MRRRVWKRSASPAEDEVFEIEPGELSGVLAAPRWLRDLGFSAWLLVGVGAALVGLIWLRSLTQTIVMPVITAAIIASVASPLVDWLRRRRQLRGERLDQRRLRRPHRGAHRRHRQARRAGRLSLLHRPQPLLPAQGRP